MRKFDSGATRDTTEGKLSYVKALSPIVLQRYVQYLDVHRKQSDGSMREFDNWKQGIPKEAYLDGLGRHFVAAWLLEHGFPASDNHGPVTLEDSLCGIIFNAMGRLHESLKKVDDQPEQVSEFTIKKAQDPRKGWYIILTKALHKNYGFRFLHKNLELHQCTGWLPHFGYGEADGYYSHIEEAKVHIAAYKNKPFVVPEGWVIRLYGGIAQDCGWFVCKENPDRYLHKNGKLYPEGRIGTGKESWHGYGEAPGYWPTEKEAEAALAAYLEKEKA